MNEEQPSKTHNRV